MNSIEVVVNQKALSRAVERLPVPSSVLRKISRILQESDASAGVVADVLKLDPAISAKVLRLANSAYIGIPHTISSLPHAVVLLGTKRIHAIVMASELIMPFQKSRALPFSIERFRRHSVTVAFLAESIGRHLRRYDAISEHEVFSAGLLHDIGKLLAGAGAPDEMSGIYHRSLQEGIPFHLAESDDFSHTALGLQIAQKWKFPEELAACISGHHTTACFPRLHRMVSIIHIADVMAHLLGYALYPDEKTPAIHDAALCEVGLPVERLRVIAEDNLKEQEKIASLLEIFDDQRHD